jgi:molybdenum cofactor biosynthesis protein MoaF
MTTTEISDQVRGRSFAFSWTDGPAKDSTHIHAFREDGTVQWHAAESDKTSEQPNYLAARIDDDACLVSYLSQSGYTLTVVLDFIEESLTGVASNDKCWYPVRGHFQVLSTVSGSGSD